MGAVLIDQRFPFINFQKSLERATTLYKADQKGAEMSIPTAFDVWDYSAKSSGGFQTIAALKMYGLLEALGSDNGRKVKLSSDALRYFKDERDEERAKLLVSFAFKPALLNSLWRQWGGQPPSDTVARSHLKIDRKLNEQSARAVLNIYKENVAFVGLSDHTGDIKGEGELDVDIQKVVNIGDFIQWTSDGVDQFSIPRKVNALAPDGKHVHVHGTLTGIPMSEVTVVPAPSVKPQQGVPLAKDGEDISVLVVGNRLQISADVDEKGLAKLKELIVKYEEILKILS